MLRFEETSWALLETALLRLLLHARAFDAFPLQEILTRAFRFLALIASGRPTFLAAVNYPVADNALLVLSSTVKHVHSPLRSS